ncbi:hypothetical protein Ancab_008409 [Ancistrocladus abbreviatus]
MAIARSANLGSQERCTGYPHSQSSTGTDSQPPHEYKNSSPGLVFICSGTDIGNREDKCIVGYNSSGATGIKSYYISMAAIAKHLRGDVGYPLRDGGLVAANTIARVIYKVFDIKNSR